MFDFSKLRIDEKCMLYEGKSTVYLIYKACDNKSYTMQIQPLPMGDDADVMFADAEKIGELICEIEEMEASA